MSRCILLPRSLSLVLIKLVVRARVGEGVCIRWSNLLAVVDCDNNFKATMVFTNSVITSLGKKRMHML
jgi:hypothetical protein